MKRLNRGMRCGLIAILIGFAPPLVHADVIADWNEKACIVVGKVGPGAPGHRMMAIVQVSIYEAVNSIAGKYPPYQTKIDAAPGASIDAAVAAAARKTLLALMPAEQAAIDSAYLSALSTQPDSVAKADGISVGEKAAAAILARANNDGATAADSYRPQTTPGVYVPTVVPAVPQWAKRTPWVMARPDQFRPGPPPSLTSDIWARDYNEVKALGAKNSTQRTAQQTDIARFWEETRPLVYFPVVRSLASAAGRSVVENARLYAAVAMAADDALIAVFDAKYAYNFWRPFTAIRNGDLDGNNATERDPSWTPFITTPMHPEYPCAHCVASGAYGAVLAAEFGDKPPRKIVDSGSATAPGMVREWNSLSEFMEEVQMARIYDGVHYRNSNEIGTALGKRVGELVNEKFLSVKR